MGRIANPLTGTQQDETLFPRLVAKIKGIGTRKLGSYGLISHETINNYCRGLPVSEGSEELIFASLGKHEEALSLKAEESKTKARGLLIA